MTKLRIKLFQDELKHYGIPGMKWGVRNGPPYPLGKQLKNKTPYKVDELKNYKGHLYFISEKNMDGATLSPRVPTNYFTENGYEDNWTKRICFSSSVDGCLKGLSQNNTGKTFNVYEAVRKPGQSVYKPNKGAVPDADITGELWLKEPTKLKAVGRINCIGDDGKDGLPFEYGDRSAELYGWKYSWSNELKHYGIPGMKWGVRRYQNSDGTWTEEGLERRRSVPRSERLEAKQRRSRILPKDKELYRITTADNEDISKNERVYVSDHPSAYDNDYFWEPGQSTYRDTYKTKEAVRVAGKQKVNQILKKVGEKKLSEISYSDDNDNWRSTGTNPDFAMGKTERDREIFKKFKEQLKKEGYGAMIDIEDLDYVPGYDITPYIFVDDLLTRTKHEKISNI